MVQQQTLGGEIAVRMKDVGVRKDAILVPLATIQVDPEWNVRDWTLPKMAARLAEMKGSLQALGQLVPGRATWDNGVVTLRGGDTRYRALCELEAEGLLCGGKPVAGMLLIQIPSKTSLVDMLAMQFGENDSKHFEMLEEAELVRRMRVAGADDQEIAARISRCVGHVSNLLILSTAPAALKQLIREERVRPTLVIDTIRELGASTATERLLRVADMKGLVKPKDLRESGSRRLTRTAVDDVIGTLRAIAHSSADELTRTLAAGTLSKYDLLADPVAFAPPAINAVSRAA